MNQFNHTDNRIHVEKEQLTIEFQLFGNLNFHEVKLFARLRHQEISVKELDQRCRHVVLGDTVYVKLSLPEKGRYVVKIYMKKKGEQGFKNICNYLISYGKQVVQGPFSEIKDGVRFLIFHHKQPLYKMISSSITALSNICYFKNII